MIILPLMNTKEKTAPALDAQRIEHDAPVIVELKQCAIGSVLGLVRRKAHDIVLRNPWQFLDGNIFPGRRRARGH